MYYSSYFVPSFLISLSKPVISQYVGGEIPDTGRSIRGALWTTALRPALGLARKILVPAYAIGRNELFVLERVLKVPSHKLTKFQVIYVDTDKFRETEQYKARSSLGFDSLLTNVLTVTRIPPPHNNPTEKDPFKLMEILGSLITNGHDQFMLYLAGFGPGERKLRELVRARELTDHVKFLGLLNHDALPLYYSASDLVFIPYQFLELNDGNAVLESFACKRAVCGFRRGVSVPIEQSGGFLIDVGAACGSMQLAARVNNPAYLKRQRC
jgi:glycosyltransferase involved in cell wall biosynthesis